MPYWAGSCWYYLRYLDPGDDERMVDPELERYWMGPQTPGDVGKVLLFHVSHLRAEAIVVAQPVRANFLAQRADDGWGDTALVSDRRHRRRPSPGDPLLIILPIEALKQPG